MIDKIKDVLNYVDSSDFLYIIIMLFVIVVTVSRLV